MNSPKSWNRTKLTATLWIAFTLIIAVVAARIAARYDRPAPEKSYFPAESDPKVIAWIAMEENARLKKRVDELEKCVDTIELGGRRYPVPNNIDPGVSPPWLVFTNTVLPNAFYAFIDRPPFDPNFILSVGGTNVVLYGEINPPSFFTP